MLPYDANGQTGNYRNTQIESTGQNNRTAYNRTADKIHNARAPRTRRNLLYIDYIVIRTESTMVRLTVASLALLLGYVG